MRRAKPSRLRRRFTGYPCHWEGFFGVSTPNTLGKVRMSAQPRIVAPWRLRTRTLELGRRTLVMGVVNITPDSFSDGGKYLHPQAAVAHALALVDEGAHLLDLGAESTRPGSQVVGHPRNLVPAVSSDEEQARLLPVLEGIRKACPDIPISVDTYKAATARAALSAGAEIVNDVSGFLWDPQLAKVCAQAQCGVVLMHTRGRPDEWRSQPILEPDTLLATVRSGLQASLERANEAGIVAESIVLDPGYGFGKRFGENTSLLARQAELLTLSRPLLAGLSRKSFLGHLLEPLHEGNIATVAARENAGLAALVVAILHGASVVRVHTVRPAVEAALITDAILDQQNE
ncbi:MAG: dihydropteroate synthase [Terracidiphilus sp.]|jgi:dihydropteroate synthase